MPMGKGNKNTSFLLSDGDTLRLSPAILLRFQSAPHHASTTIEACFDTLQRVEMEVRNGPT